MSFQSKDLMIDLSPVARPGFEMCGQATRDSQEGGDPDNELECGQATRDGDPTESAGFHMAALRRQLRDTLALEAR
jgi:hypothetical protein